MGIELMALTAGMQAGSAYNKSKAEKNALNAQAETYDNNALIAKWQQEQAIQNGVVNEQMAREKAAGLKSTQRANLAANGVDLGEGSATDILATTDLNIERDAAQIKLNAMQQAWGYENAGINYKNQATGARAGAASISPAMAVATSLLGSATSYSMSNYQMNKLRGTNTGGSSLSVIGGKLG